MFLFVAAADVPVNRADPAQVTAMKDPVSFAAAGADKVKALVLEAKAALSHLHKLVLPRLPQEKSLHDLAETFIVKEKTAVEVLKRNSKIYGAVLALQLMMGCGVELNYEEAVQTLPKNKDGVVVDLSPFAERATVCAAGLIQFTEASSSKKAPAADGGPSASAQTNLPPP